MMTKLKYALSFVLGGIYTILFLRVIEARENLVAEHLLVFPASDGRIVVVWFFSTVAILCGILWFFYDNWKED